MEKFSNAVAEALNFYVYCLVDPRDRTIFYIGKGSGDRVFDHVNEALRKEADEDEKSLKLDTIRDLREKGLKVGYYILRHNLNEKEAYIVESTLIDLLTYPEIDLAKHVLTNKASGHHQLDEGIKTVEELEALYECEPIDIQESDRGSILMVCLNRSFEKAKKAGLYEATRKCWAISKKRYPRIRYVFGVYRGIVRSVIEVDKSKSEWVNADGETTFKRERCSFAGQLLDESPYLNKDVSAYPFGSGSAIRYID